MNTQPLRIAVIGSGRWGKNIIKTLGSNPGCLVVYTVTRNYKELLKKEDIDAVVIATPPATHASIALPFIERRMPVFIEKPLTTSLSDAKRLQAASAKYKTPVFVGHIHLYNPAFIKAKELLKRVGKLQMISGEGASNGPFRDDYSAMWDWAPHDLSMMLDLAGAKPLSVQAWGESLTRKKSRLHDFTIMKILFPSGLVGVIHSSKLSPEKRRKLTIVGSRSSIIYDDTAEKKVTFFEDSGPTISSNKVKENQPILSYPTYEAASPLTQELKAFLEMARTHKKPKTDLASGLEVVAILEAAEQSIKAGGKIIKIKR